MVTHGECLAQNRYAIKQLFFNFLNQVKTTEPIFNMEVGDSLLENTGLWFKHLYVALPRRVN